MDKLKMHTPNRADENFKKLAALFPNAVTETITGYDENGKPIIERAIDKDVLMQEISCTVVDGKEERYQFTWPDKKKSILLANAPLAMTLRPIREDEEIPSGRNSDGKPYCSTGSLDFDKTENLYIEGDNLEVLKLLQETYLGKIKMIYIDPPYNTGNDFVYEDDFAQSTDEYLANSGQFDSDGNRLVANTESNGRFHTDWLNMIYPRLKIAKDLLADDGVILVSIGDKELRNLQAVMDEIYGANNQVCCFVYTISDIDPFRGTVTFTNGEVIKAGEVSGDVSESDMRRIQIRETILSHFEKEEKLFNMGIKSLSLFFIDEVSKYRQYDADGNEVLGEYGQMFEQEYLNVLNDYITIFDTPYQKYLKSTCSDVSAVHKGYFSIDKKTGRSIDSQLKRGSEFSDDISAYDLILKNKERLLSFEEPTRFIFSHSALREGWDNPNVFQICTLKHSDSQTAKRQEVGRGLRLCVNQFGNRMDVESCGDSVHDINMLTVIASESYKGFVADLQSDIKTVLYDRPTTATSEYFNGKYVKVDGTPTLIDKNTADTIEFYLISNGYVDMKRKVTDKYRTDVKMGTVAPLPEEIQPMTEGIHTLIQSVYDDSVLKDMFSDGHETKVKENPLNDNFAKAEFQALWKQINHRYAYTVEFDSDELIRKSIAHINEKLFVSELQYTTTIGRQKTEMNEHEVARGASFTGEKTRTQTLKHAQTSQIKYDLIGKIAEGTVLTRKTVAAILKGLRADRLYMFKNNPEEFISKVVKLIKEQKATMIVEHISYDQLEGGYDSTIFTAEKSSQTFDKAFHANKAIQDYVFTDGSAEKSIERRFVEDLDAAQEVCVYAKLPKGFHIPTPVGNYSPDWAIAFYEGTVKHIFFVAETKGTMDSLNLRPIEQAKISCAKKLFNEMSTSNVKYHDVDSYQNLLNVMKSL